MSKQMSRVLKLMLEYEQQDVYIMRVLTPDDWWNGIHGRPGICYMHGPVDETLDIYHDGDRVFFCAGHGPSECHAL